MQHLDMYIADALRHGLSATGAEKELNLRWRCVQRWREAARALPAGIKQRTEEWHEARQQMITASDFAQATGFGKFGTQAEFLARKAGYVESTFDASCPPLRWGVKYEPVACMVYERRTGLKVQEFGLLRHPKYPFIGASPDGINELGVMLEIKCPWRRRITGEVPEQYFAQIQGQLDVCGLDECDYLECEIEEAPEPPAEPGEREWGAVAEFEAEGGAARYEYSQPCQGAPQEWRRAPGLRALTYWTMRKYAVQRVVRDPDYVARMMADLAVVWGKVLQYRRDRALFDAEVAPLLPGPARARQAAAIQEDSGESLIVIED